MVERGTYCEWDCVGGRSERGVWGSEVLIVSGIVWVGGVREVCGGVRYLL